MTRFGHWRSGRWICSKGRYFWNDGFIAKPPCKNKNTRPRKRDECDSAIVVPPSFGRQSAPRQASNKAPANNAATRPGLLHSAGRRRDELSMRTAASAYTHRRLSAPVESASYSLHSLLGERIVWYYYRQGAEKCQAPWILYSSIRLLSDSGGLILSSQRSCSAPVSGWNSRH